MSGFNYFQKQDQMFNNFNVNSNHPLIPNSQEYIYYKKYVSIHSEDRDFLKYPLSSEFEIEMPEDITNIVCLRLIQWTFPANYNTFSLINSNTAMSFKINKPYNPNINGLSDILAQKIFEFFFYNNDINYVILIQEGFYNPQQMVTELTNKFNYVVTLKLQEYFTQKSTDPTITPQEQQDYVQALTLLNQSDGYNNFIVVYNNVSQKIWFGNISDGFILTNELSVIKDRVSENIFCTPLKTQIPDFSDFGLPGYLGFSRRNIESINGKELNDIGTIANYNGTIVPRFYYGDVNPGDNGFWLLPNPNYPNSTVNWVEAEFKINLMGPSYIYMELEGQNCIDETSPYNISEFTTKTNQTNGIVNSAFAKLSIPTTPISQWFDKESLPYKFYYPPAERMRRLKIRFRYHNGQIVNFGLFNYSFVIEFTTQLPQILRKSNSVIYSPKL